MGTRDVSPDPSKIVGSKKLIQLNVGGTNYVTTLSTLLREPNSLLATCIGQQGGGGKRNSLPSDSLKARPNALPGTESIIEQQDGAYFIDRDGVLFRYVLDYLRNGKLLLPEPFRELSRLREEAKFFHLPGLGKMISKSSNASNGAIPSLPLTKTWPNLHFNHSTADFDPSNAEHTGYITVGYRGTFAFGRDGQSDVNFRKLNRILVCGKARLCREVFGDNLNESRDPDRGGEERYTSRLYLKHNSLERAFDQLAERGFLLLTACGSGASGGVQGMQPPPPGTSADYNLPRTNQMDSEEHRWNHYNEFIFYRNGQCSVADDKPHAD